jgi:hypothetical protein
MGLGLPAGLGLEAFKLWFRITGSQKKKYIQEERIP